VFGVVSGAGTGAHGRGRLPRGRLLSACEELQAGINRTLEPDMSYTLRIMVQPHDPQQPIQIRVQTSTDEDICRRDDAGQIAQWTIDVL